MSAVPIRKGPAIVVVMGVSGSGKTTVGRLLATRLGWPFVEGDDLHPPANVAKMSRGEPLSDADRAPWLAALRRRIDALVAADTSAVVTCSALRQTYRHVLTTGRPEVTLVWLRGGYALIAERLRARRGHFMPPTLLRDQFDTLETPTGVLTVDVDREPEALVEEIRRALGLEPGSAPP